MKQVVLIYKFGDKMYFAPTHSFDEMVSTIKTPITALDKINDGIAIACQLQLSFNQCSYGNNSNPENGYKELLKISKAKSSVKLVSTGIVVSCTLEGNRINLELLYGDLTTKSFNAYRPSRIIELYYLDISNHDLGLKIIELFSEADRV